MVPGRVQFAARASYDWNQSDRIHYITILARGSFEEVLENLVQGASRLRIDDAETRR